VKFSIVGPAYPYRGGIAHYTALLAGALAERHQVSVFTFSRMYPDLFFPGTTQYDESASPLGGACPRALDSVAPWTWLSTGRALARMRPDVIVVQWFHAFFGPAYAGAVLSARRWHPRTRVLYLCHNIYPHEHSLLFRPLARVLLRVADGFICHSRQDTQTLRHLGLEGPVAVADHPTYEVLSRRTMTRAEARRRLGLDGDVLLFFGYVRAYKGLRQLIEALPLILRERPSVRLLIVGEFYEDRQAHEELIARLGVGHRVTIVDRYVPNEQVSNYFAAADLVVQPYLSTTQSGVTQLAFGCGRPVLVTRVGGLPDAVEDGVTGLLVPPGDPGAICRAVLRFFAEDLAPAMERSITQRRPRFGWDHLVSTIEYLDTEVRRARGEVVRDALRVAETR
jgi:glycosyltransferase involved in cell wall biosynthesis